MNRVISFIKQYKFFLLLHFTVFLWGFTGVLGKLIEGSSLQITILRTSIAFTSLLLYLIIGRKMKKIPIKHILQYLGVGVIIGFHWYAFFESIHQSNVSVALTCLASASLFVAILNPFIGTQKVFKPYELLLGLMAILGIYIVFNFEGQYTLGIILGLITSFLGAVFTIINGNFIDRKDDATHITLYEMLGACITIGICGLFNSEFTLDFQFGFNDWIYVIILGTLCTAFAFLLGIYVMKEVSAYTVTMTVNLEPIYSIAMALIIFKEDEHMSPGFYLGAFIIMLSIFLNGIISKRLRNKAKLKPVDK